MLSQTYFKNTQLYSIHNEITPAIIGGVYKVTLDSESALGLFKSEGKAIITQKSEHEYEIKAVLYPIDAPAYAITAPYYIYATAKETSDPQNLLCSGQVYVKKGFFHKYVPGDDVAVNLKEKLTSETNTYEFALNPFTLWGFSPGKISNKGTLEHVSGVVDEKSRDEVAFCDTLKMN